MKFNKICMINFLNLSQLILLLQGEICSDDDLLERCWVKRQEDCDTCGCCFLSKLHNSSQLQKYTEQHKFKNNRLESLPLCYRSLTNIHESSQVSVLLDNKLQVRPCSTITETGILLLEPLILSKANQLSTFVFIIEKYLPAFITDLKITDIYNRNDVILLSLSSYKKLTNDYMSKENLNLTLNILENTFYYCEFTVYFPSPSTYDVDVQITDPTSNKLFNLKKTFVISPTVPFLLIADTRDRSIFVRTPKSVRFGERLDVLVYVLLRFDRTLLSFEFGDDVKQAKYISSRDEITVDTQVYLIESFSHVYTRAGRYVVSASIGGENSYAVSDVVSVICPLPTVSVQSRNRSKLFAPRVLIDKPIGVFANISQRCSQEKYIRVYARLVADFDNEKGDDTNLVAGQRITIKVMTQLENNVIKATLFSDEYDPGIYRLQIFISVPFANLNNEITVSDDTWFNLIEYFPEIIIRGPRELEIWAKAIFNLIELKSNQLELIDSIRWYCYESLLFKHNFNTDTAIKYKLPFSGFSIEINGDDFGVSHIPKWMTIVADVKIKKPARSRLFFHQFQIVIQKVNKMSTENIYALENMADVYILCLQNCFFPVIEDQKLSLFVSCPVCNYIKLNYRWELYKLVSDEYQVVELQWLRHANFSVNNKLISILPSTFHWTSNSTNYKFFVIVNQDKEVGTGRAEYNFTISPNFRQNVKATLSTSNPLLLRPYLHSSAHFDAFFIETIMSTCLCNAYIYLYIH